MNFSAKAFKIPAHLSVPAQVEYLKKILERYRSETLLLRKETAYSRQRISQLEEERERLLEEIRKQKERNDSLQKERDRLKKQEEVLRKQIEKLTKTNARYTVALFDHGNFKHLTNGKDSRMKGGQIGHADTNRENQKQFLGYDQFSRKRVFAKYCRGCGNSLKRVNACKGKVLLDITLHPEIIKLVIESERQWCSFCKKEIRANDERSLPFTEYGLNTLMMVLILRFKAHCSIHTICKVMEISFGLKISPSEVMNLLKKASLYLGQKYEELKQAVRQNEVLYMDETGWQVRGKSAWMWIMADEKTTVYVAAESRGKGIAEEILGSSQAFCMTDGYVSYKNSIPQDKHLYCWAHLLRFAHEETIDGVSNSASVHVREELVRMYHLKKTHPEYSQEQLELKLTEKLDNLLTLKSNEQAVLNILHRVRVQKDGLIQALLFTESGTNNLAERELRPLVLGRKVSFGSDTYQGMEQTAILSSVIQTLSRQQTPFLSELKKNLLMGINPSPS